MRAGLIGLSGGLIGSLIGSTAFGSSFTFDTVMNSDASLADNSTLSNVDQVAVGAGGQVATLIQVGTDGASVVYNAAGSYGNGNVQTIVNSGSDTYSHLIVSDTGGTKLTYVSNNAGAIAISQYNLNTAVNTTIATDDGSHDFSGEANSGQIPLQANASGKVVYPVAGTGPGPENIVSFNGAHQVVATSTDAQNFNHFTVDGTSDPAGPRHAITSIGDVIYIDVIAIDGGSGLTTATAIKNATINSTLVSSGFTIGSNTDAIPTQLIGATPNQVLFRADFNSNSEHAVVVHDGSGDHLVGTYDPSGPFGANGEISENGKVAVLLPDADGNGVDLLRYYSGGTIHDIGVGSSVDEGATIGAYTITGLSLNGDSTPMINNNGLVVFDATIQSGGDTYQAFLLWYEGLINPQVIIKAGTTSGDPMPFSIAFAQQLIPYAHSMSYAGDSLKDGLSEDNRFAFGVNYSGAGDGEAVLITDLLTLPEPSSAALGLIAIGGMLMRRRHH